MKHPEIPKKTSRENSSEELKNLRREVQLPAEAIQTRDSIVDTIADARDSRLALIQSMQQERNVPKVDLRKMEMILTT